MEQSMNIGMQDPNNTGAGPASAGGKTKIRRTDLSGDSGRPTGASYDESLASEKAWAPTAGGSGFNPSTSASEAGYASGANTLYDENNTAPTSV